MLFNSYPFLLIFLPLTLLIFFAAAKLSHWAAAAWLTLASVVFYGWWNPAHVTVLLLSIVFNFSVGQMLARRTGTLGGRIMLVFGVALDLGLLAYYKYADFFIGNLNALGSDLLPPGVVMPIGISFFTFTQIAFLVDVYRGHVAECRFTHYCLFVSYFPHLVAGPILHHREMMPQFTSPGIYAPQWDCLAAGFTVFFIGLFKKTVIADGVAVYVRPVFDAARDGVAISAVDAWGGALAYAFQLYFDFSGYSDMAIGLSLMFGVRLPLNFNSPYKATSIIDFWRRWHITLSRFLRDYLYFLMGGNRRGRLRRYINLLITMILGGFWHGASWTFVMWGALHGIYLLINHAWRELASRAGLQYGWVPRPLCWMLTFTAVVIAWVFFRAETVAGAMNMLRAMFGANGITLPYHWLEKLGVAGEWLARQGVVFGFSPTFAGGSQINRIIVCALIAFFAPNTQQIMGAFRTAQPDDQMAILRWWMWRPAPGFLLLIAVAGAFAVMSLNEISEFIYFQF